MNRWRTTFDRLGGQEAVSWPLFWATFAISVIAQFAVPQPSVPLSTRIVALLAAQAAMFIPLVAIRWTVLRRPRRPYPWLVLTSYVAATVLRAGVLYLMLIPSEGVRVTFGSRLSASVLNLLFIMILTTLIVSISRQNARDQARLIRVREDLDETRAGIERQMAEENAAALASVQKTLADELARLDDTPDNSGALESLQRLASDVVRPMSHDLAHAVPSWRPEDQPIPNSRVNWSDVLMGMTHSGPFRPLITTTLVSMIMLAPTFVYLQADPVLTMGAIVVSTFSSFTLANVVLDRVLPSVGRAASACMFLVVAVIASAIPASLVGFLERGASGLLLAVLGTAFVLAVALLTAAISQALAAQALTTRELKSSNEDLRLSLVRLHQAQWFHQRALARALHGSMQSAVVAAAFRLEAARDAGELDTTLISHVRAELTDSINVLTAGTEQPINLDDFITQVTQVWSRVVELDIHADEGARETLAAEPILRAIVMEVTTEEISNAVRHGRARSVYIAVRQLSDDNVALMVLSDSTTSAGRGERGLGTRLLDECASSWCETKTDGGRQLLATFPRGASGSPKCRNSCIAG